MPLMQPAPVEEGNKYPDVPSPIQDALKMYAVKRYETGSFLRACLENDLIEAAVRADHYNRSILFEIASYIYNELPAISHGSPEKVRAWLAGGKS